MRFSLKWLLAAMAYIAVAVAAIAGNRPLFADALWVLTIVAFNYAAFVSIASRGRNPAAVGFVVLWATNLVALYAAPDRVPSSHFLQALGYGVTTSGFLVWKDNAGQFITTAEAAAVVRTANAVGTMAAGLVGSVLAAAAYCRAKADAD